VTFPSFLTNPFSLNTFVTATISSPSASSGSITISIAPMVCTDVFSHSFTITMTDSLNTAVFAIQIDVLDPVPFFSYWRSPSSPYYIPVGSI
jgi:hypothetical protein